MKSLKLVMYSDTDRLVCVNCSIFVTVYTMYDADSGGHWAAIVLTVLER